MLRMAASRGVLAPDCDTMFTMPDREHLIVFDHPLIRHKLARLRDRDTGHPEFRDLIEQVAALMVYELTRTFETVEVEVTTPLDDRVTCGRIQSEITLIPILRAGLGMTSGILSVLPEARVGHLGMSRDEQTMMPTVYLRKLPRDLSTGPIIVVDPMLATGGSAVRAIRILREAGAVDLRLICLVAAPEGVRAVREADPAVTVYAAALDEKLDETGFIRPGLGDAGDRQFGTL